MSSTEPQPQFYSVRAFCEAHGISRSFFYRLVRQGKGPALTKLGGRTLISHESAAQWRASLTEGSDLGEGAKRKRAARREGTASVA